MGMTEKIKILLGKKQMSGAQLAELLDTKPSNLYNKFKRDNFSEKDLQKIAEALDCKYEGFFFLDNGDQIWPHNFFLINTELLEFLLPYTHWRSCAADTQSKFSQGSPEPVPALFQIVSPRQSGAKSKQTEIP